MPTFLRLLAALAAGLAATAARAEFHTFQIEELYSNGDGTVQYVVLHESQGMDGENLLGGHTLTSMPQGGQARAFVFPNNLPGGICGYNGCTESATANKRVLIATPGFTALNLGVTPDYTIPSGFLPTSAGTLNYALVDQVSWSALPTDGANALSRSNAIIPNLATNFAGRSASVAGVAAVNYQGLWFNPAESGWGINFAHEGDIIFASWFTFDLTGKGTWLVMQANKTAPNVYSGQLIQGTGPAFDAVPFPPIGSPGGATVSGLGGTGTITFTDANNATFTYTVAGISQVKSITRQLFGAQPVCTFGAQPNLALATNYTALWFASPANSEAGWGINLTHQGDIIFATWFTFDHDHTPMWLVVQANKTAPNTYTGQLLRGATGPAFSAVPFPPIGSPGGAVGAPEGTATFTFSDGNNASFHYTVEGVTQTKAITRQVLVPPATTCQ